MVRDRCTRPSYIADSYSRVQHQQTSPRLDSPSTLNIGQVVLFGEIGRQVADLAESSIRAPPRINEPYVLFPRFLAYFLYSNKDSVLVWIA